MKQRRISGSARSPCELARSLAQPDAVENVDRRRWTGDAELRAEPHAEIGWLAARHVQSNCKCLFLLNGHGAGRKDGCLRVLAAARKGGRRWTRRRRRRRGLLPVLSACGAAALARCL